MTIEETIAAAVESRLRAVVREELRAVVADLRPTDDGYICVEKAAAFADVHPDTIRAWVKNGRLPEHRAGRELRVLRSELHRALEAARPEAAAGRESAEEEAESILNRRRRG